MTNEEIEEIDFIDDMYYPNGQVKTKTKKISSESGDKVSFLSQSEMDKRQELLREHLAKKQYEEIAKKQEEANKRLKQERAKWLEEQLEKMGET